MFQAPSASGSGTASHKPMATPSTSLVNQISSGCVVSKTPRSYPLPHISETGKSYQVPLEKIEYRRALLVVNSLLVTFRKTPETAAQFLLAKIQLGCERFRNRCWSQNGTASFLRVVESVKTKRFPAIVDILARAVKGSTRDARLWIQIRNWIS